jgi:hypothetical protein
MNARIFFSLIPFLFATFHSAYAQNMRISNMNDINLGTWTPATAMTGNDPVCVYRSSGGDKYSVTGTDNSTLTPAQFRLQNSAGTVEIPYTVKWSNTAAAGTLAMTDGSALNASNADRKSQSCTSGLKANFRIDVTAAALSGKPAGTYTTTVRFVVRAR